MNRDQLPFLAFEVFTGNGIKFFYKNERKKNWRNKVEKYR